MSAVLFRAIRWIGMLGLLISSLNANATDEFPVLFQGRYRPADAYARLWLYDLYHAQTLKKEHLAAFHAASPSPILFLWSLEFEGSTPFQESPLFRIGGAEEKRSLGLPLERDRFSYQELKETMAKLDDELPALAASLREFEKLQSPPYPLEDAFRNRFAQLKSKGTSPKEIERLLEQEYPLIQRLRSSGSLFKSLPSRFKEGEWLPLGALTVQMYRPSSNSLEPVGNFTQFTDENFNAVRQAYLKTRLEGTEKENLNSLAEALTQAYIPLAGTIFQEAHGKNLSYPTVNQLRTETLYLSYPWIPLLILLYGLTIFLLIAAFRFPSIAVRILSITAMTAALICHTALLAMRCYILQRPPVSNMFETVIYVPWVAGCASLLIPGFRRQPFAMIAACIASVVLLLIIQVTALNQSLDQVQAVLDSQFWLMIHVLLVVGSYGIFILGAILGHFYLGLFLLRRQETGSMALISRLILQTMYGGTALLVAGTILGGIWAAESWGRFWDWDPKESWAFISSCFYLIWIHAYRFRRIGSFGLAVGSVGGLLAISFTWYGVNYILGTGLHSYGFGSGGYAYYYSFLAAECLFIGASLWVRQNKWTNGQWTKDGQ